MTEMDSITAFALAYLAAIIVIPVCFIVKTLYFTWKVKREGDEISVERWIGLHRFYRYIFNAKTKEQKLYALINGDGGRIYHADWRGVVKKISDPGETRVMKRKEFDQKVIAGQLHPATWVIFKNDITDLNAKVETGKLIDNKYFREPIKKYRLREVAMEHLEAVKKAEQ